ncbi:MULTISPECIES: hypothetical protein [Desulfosporosinus]|uniref:Uncharacterized protein n=1 Tax=Desulfosporosinus lacus DSM 15449 TaxID=1121420 RepID=A0A1M5XBV7_9FIRM|nr:MULTISPECIES: hypothetical protein [Desulfosporosinus]MCO5387604.1 hypothetical protein [Desulfosporosinus sp.]MDA8223465.1 hypothetical protein [Desulfitobacterium hafniense]SHH97219.1 hypothetical protein SAMN02746098_01922 [Desulfosporosinus lacus DSM 15449]
MTESELRTEEHSSVNVQEVLSEDEWYPLLPVEKKLISITLGLGLVLMVVFIIVFKVFE